MSDSVLLSVHIWSLPRSWVSIQTGAGWEGQNPIYMRRWNGYKAEVLAMTGTIERKEKLAI